MYIINTYFIVYQYKNYPIKILFTYSNITN